MLQSIDANFAYSWLHSAYFDLDFDFENEFRHIGGAESPSEIRAYFLGYLNNGPKTELGGPLNLYGIAPGLLSAPLYALVHRMLPLFASDAGRIASFSHIFPLTFIAAGIIFGFMGLALTWRVLNSAFPKPTSFAALFILMFGTPLFSVLRFDPGNPSLFSFFLSAVFVLASSVLAAELAELDLRGRVGDLAISALSTGLFLGLLCSARMTNILFILLPLSLARRVLIDSGPHRRSFLSLGALGLGLLFISGAIIGLAPQLLAWKTHIGSLASLWNSLPNLEMSVRRLLNLLVFPPYGLFFTSPISAVALLGLIMGWIRGRALPSCGLLITAVGLAVYSALADLSPADGLGFKNSVDYGLFIAVGLAEMLDMLMSRTSQVLAVLLGLILCLPNIGAASAARKGLELQRQTAAEMLLLRRDDLFEQALNDFDLFSLLAAPKVPLVSRTTSGQEP